MHSKACPLSYLLQHFASSALSSRRVRSSLHITCLLLSNNLAFLVRSGELLSVLCPSPCLRSVEGILKELVVSMGML